jgi:hypothetical protein
MARFRESNIQTIPGACPICGSDVKGDDVYLYFCKPCNVLFKKEELNIANKKHVNILVREKVSDKYSKDKEKLKIDIEKIKEKPAVEKVIYYFASKKSDIVHASNCPYGKNIKSVNRIRFKSLSEAKNYKRCRCIV